MDDQDYYGDQVDDDFYVFADQIDSIVDSWLYLEKDKKDSQPRSTKKSSTAVVPAGSKGDMHLPQQQHLPEGAGHSGGSGTEDSGELPTLHSLLGHSEFPANNSKAAGHRSSKQHPSAADASLAAAVGGVLALTGSLLSYTIARVKGSRRERKLQQGLAAKEQALAAAQKELGRTKKQVVVLKEAADRRHSLEAELAASRANLEAMTTELEAARAASRKIECDMAVFQDQLLTLSSSKQQSAEAMAAAEQRVLQAEQQRQDAEVRWQKAYRELEAAQEELDTVKGELGLRGSQLEGLTRELEFTRRQLVEAEKRAERAHMESRSARSGYAAEEYDSWD
ncbi:hypothetical protein OEZ85_004434 [Tetradesmus obliquus]|uniref:Uncharacterized protein n=1 Tax=Tetradesmus obliquus TaxID=3088 RepID=A0ABY8ULF3_TETOB|nr:hypothetical protein OEZ85_004434 [Tetradesmus obliquus]